MDKQEIIYKLSNDSLVKCTFYDAGGSIRIRTANEHYIKKSQGFIVVFDLTNKNSFEEVRDYFIPKIRELCGLDAPVMIIGNKKDMKHLREVNYDEVEELAMEYGYYYYETSCIDNYNLHEIFGTIVEQTYNFAEKNNLQVIRNDTFSLNNNRNNNFNGHRNGRGKCLTCC